jgi:hypothetical protein
MICMPSNRSGSSGRVIAFAGGLAIGGIDAYASLAAPPAAPRPNACGVSGAPPPRAALLPPPRAPAPR